MQAPIDADANSAIEALIQANDTLRVELERRQQSEARLAQDLAQAQSVMDCVAEAYVAIDRTGRIIDWNPQAEQLFGWSRADCLGREMAELIIPERLRDSHQQGLQRFLETGAGPVLGRRTELAGLCRDGSEVPIELLIWVSHSAEGDGQRFNALISDISERRRAILALHDFKNRLEHRVEDRTRELLLAKAEAEEASRAKSSFLATMSHEIRTPMNGIIGMIEVLTQSRLGDSERDAVQTIRSSALSLLGLLDDILDFSKIEAGRLELEREPLALTELAENTTRALVTMAAGRAVDLSVFVDPQLPEWIWGDPTRLRQILTNLLSNAIKFSGDQSHCRGRVNLRLTPVVGPDQSEAVRISVTDNGIGMSPEAQARLFTVFSQAEASTTRRFGGTGLGLTICQRLVGMMRGSIRVQSEQGVGTEVSVEVPIDAMPTDMEMSQRELENVSCWIIESEDIRPADLAAYLRHAGAEVGVVANWALAARAAQACTGTVVILHAFGHERLIPEVLQAAFADAGNARHVVIGRGRRRQVRIAGGDIISIDGDAMARATLLQAVAAAAGLQVEPLLGVAQRDADNATHAAVTAPSISEARAEGRLILVAEDDEVNQKVILRQLSLLGYAAEVVENGAQALRAWRQDHHALLLSDLHMPVLDGYGLVTAIRLEEAGCRPMPILALTANALTGEAQRARALGFDEYLTKPIQLQRLREAMARWMPTQSSATTTADATTATRHDADAEAGAGGTQVIDISVLRNLIGDDAESIREVLIDYLASLRRQGSELCEAAACGDTGHVGEIAHKLKSSSRSVGALALGDLCAELQNAGRTADRQAVADGIVKFNASVQTVETSIERYLAG